MTITGKLFRAYAQELIAKHCFGTNKMIGRPSFWKEYQDQLAGDQGLFDQTLTKVVDERIAEEKSWGLGFPFMGQTEPQRREWLRNDVVSKWAAKCTIWDKASDELEASLKFLIDNGYMREWTKKVRFGTAHYYGLTAKGWAIADKYLSAN